MKRSGPGAPPLPFYGGLSRRPFVPEILLSSTERLRDGTRASRSSADGRFTYRWLQTAGLEAFLWSCYVCMHLHRHGAFNLFGGDHAHTSESYGRPWAIAPPWVISPLADMRAFQTAGIDYRRRTGRQPSRGASQAKAGMRRGAMCAAKLVVHGYTPDRSLIF